MRTASLFLLLLSQTACVGTKVCGWVEVGGDVGGVYVDDGKELPLTGRFEDRCTVRWMAGGSSPGLGTGTIYTPGGVDWWLDDRKRAIDSNIATWWWLNLSASMVGMQAGDVLSVEDVSPTLYYDPIIRAGDGFIGDLPNFGAATEGQITLLDSRTPGDCDRVEVKLEYDYAWGEDLGDDTPWATAKGWGWWHYQDPSAACGAFLDE